MQQLIVSRITQTQGFPNSSLLFFFSQLRVTDLHGREGIIPELLWMSGPALPLGWAEPCAFVFQIHSFWRSWSQNCKTTRAQGIRSCEWLRCMFDLTENIKQLALCSPLCHVYKMIITAKKRQQELSTSSTNHPQSGTLTQWCQNTFPFPLEQSYYFMLANGGEKSGFKPMGKWHNLQGHEQGWWAHRTTQGEAGLPQRTSEGKRLDREKASRVIPWQQKSRKRQRHLHYSNGAKL